MGWQETAREYVEDPAKVESADAETIQKLLTTHVRKERFFEGHLAAMFENGHVVALLQKAQGDSRQLEGAVSSGLQKEIIPCRQKRSMAIPEGRRFVQSFRLENLHEFQVRCQRRRSPS